MYVQYLNIYMKFNYIWLIKKYIITVRSKNYRNKIFV